ncbi:MAG: OmpH family outer membrane protein [Gemmatimonadaceae bacterium]
MRKGFLTGVCALLMSAPALSAQTPPQKIAVISSQQLFQIAPGRDAAQATFEKEQIDFRAKLQKMSDSLQELQAKYSKEEVSLSPTAKEARQKALRATETELQEKAAKMNEAQQSRENELMAPILELIKKALEEVRVEGGYSFILDAASTSGVLAAFDKNLDVTDAVMTKMKLLAPKAPVKAGPTAAPAGIKKPPMQ